MDQNIANVIIAVITGLFSIFILVVEQRNDKAVDKIDRRQLFDEKEKEVKQKIADVEKRKDDIIQKMILIILDSNIWIFKGELVDQTHLDELCARRDKSLKDYDEAICMINDLVKEEKMISKMASDYENELKKQESKKKK